MPLINSPRHTAEDIAAWRRLEELASVHVALPAFRSRIKRASEAVRSFVAGGGCYAGVSWGKDSIVLAHLIALLAPAIPLVWIRVTPMENPDCVLVRDAFLRIFPNTNYDEIVTRVDPALPTGRLEDGFAEAARRYGQRYLSGVRGEESGGRARRMRAWGESSPNTCAPIGRWSGHDVFGYLLTNDLPIHPAYACTMGGLLDSRRIRVASLGGSRGEGMGRHEWEERYYGVELAALSRTE